MSLRKIIIQVHLLLGLFIFPYLIIFGITSLNFNHGFTNAYEYRKETKETVSIQTPKTEDDVLLIEALKDSLGIFGWVNKRSTYRDSLFVHSVVQHPGKEYQIEVNTHKNQVSIQTKTKSFLWVLNALHGLGEIVPGAPWYIKFWKYYQLISVMS